MRIGQQGVNTQMVVEVLRYSIFMQSGRRQLQQIRADLLFYIYFNTTS